MRPTVIAYIDTGINPYHDEFAAPALTDPAEVIPGFPKDAKPLNLSLGTDSFREAWDQDEGKWESQERGQLYYVPGTKIVGTIWFYGGEFGQFDGGFDEDGHGTAVASVGSGNDLGTAPDSLVVAVDMGDIQKGLDWVANQSWIDVVSLSVGNYGQVGQPPLWLPNVPLALDAGRITSPADRAYEITQSGRTVVAGSGNGLSKYGSGMNVFADIAGPPWVFTAGIYEPGAIYDGCTPLLSCGRPHEVIVEDDRPAATTESINKRRSFTGTSASAPALAGYEAGLIHLARERLNDTTGVQDRLYAKADPGTVLPGRGPLADGALNRTEIETVLRHSARPLDFEFESGGSLGQTVRVEDPAQTRYLDQGYGLYNRTAHDLAERVLLGETPMPDRPGEDRMHALVDDVRGTYWYTWMCQARERVPTPFNCPQMAALASRASVGGQEPSPLDDLLPGGVSGTGFAG